MAIDKKRLLNASASHFPNETKQTADESGTKLKNHQEASDLLFDPADAEGGNTHSDKPIKTKVVKASVEGEDEDLGFDSIEEAMPSESDETEASLYADEGMAPSILDQADEDELLDQLDETDEGEAVAAELETIAPELSEDESSGDNDGLAAELTEDESELCGGEDGLNIVDLDATEDAIEDSEVLCFASIGSNLHCIKANRIIATMTKGAAVKAGVADIYTTDAFATAVGAEVEAKGLRKGLTASGFGLSKVVVLSNKVIKAAVDAELSKQSATLQASTGKGREAFTQCLAIAAVGLNRNFFKGQSNTLRASLESELTNAGVRGASKIVRAMFAQHGVDYAKSLVTLATKLSAMPEETRNQFVEALDMTDEVMADTDDDVDADEFDPDDGDDDEAPQSVQAALLKPLHAFRAVGGTSRSSSAAEVLSGAKPLPFLA